MHFVFALIPFLLGPVYYGPLLGKAGMKTNGMTEADLEISSLAVIFGVWSFFCLLFTFFKSSIVKH